MSFLKPKKSQPVHNSRFSQLRQTISKHEEAVRELQEKEQLLKEQKEQRERKQRELFASLDSMVRGVMSDFGKTIGLPLSGVVGNDEKGFWSYTYDKGLRSFTSDGPLDQYLRNKFARTFSDLKVYLMWAAERDFYFRLKAGWYSGDWDANCYRFESSTTGVSEVELIRVLENANV